MFYVCLWAYNKSVGVSGLVPDKTDAVVLASFPDTDQGWSDANHYKNKVEAILNK